MSPSVRVMRFNVPQSPKFERLSEVAGLLTRGT